LCPFDTGFIKKKYTAVFFGYLKTIWEIPEKGILTKHMKSINGMLLDLMEKI